MSHSRRRVLQNPISASGDASYTAVLGLSLDIKNGFGFDPRVFLDTLACIERHGLIERVMLIGWDHHGLLEAKKRNPEIATRALIRGRPVDIVQMAQRANVDAVNLDADMVTEAEVSALHEAGIALVMAETVSPDFSRPVRLGADVVCCKDPGAARVEIDALVGELSELTDEEIAFV